MLTFLIRLLVKNPDQTDSPDVRRACGVAAATLGIALNLVLFALKLAAGLLSGSIGVTADAFNSLSDAGSSLVTMIGFRLSGRRPDNSHPFGHGRVEYIAGLIVAMSVILMGAELLKSSIAGIVSPENVSLSPLTAVILLVSIGVKAYMCLYNRALGRRIDSAAVRAAALDSLGDALSTSAALLALLIAHLTGLRVDGWAGLIVSLVILRAGVSAAKETISPLLGEAPSPELVERIRRGVLENECVLGVHDLVVHDYGPGRRMVSLHAEVPADGSLLTLHEAIDGIERRLGEELNCDAVIHMDPVVTDDGRVAPLRDAVTEQLRARIDGRLTVHDFRIVDGASTVKLVFDVVAPFDLALSDEGLTAAVEDAVQEIDKKYHTAVRIDRG